MAEFCKVPWFQGTYISGRPGTKVNLYQKHNLFTLKFINYNY